MGSTDDGGARRSARTVARHHCASPRLTARAKRRARRSARHGDAHDGTSAVGSTDVGAPKRPLRRVSVGSVSSHADTQSNAGPSPAVAHGSTSTDQCSEARGSTSSDESPMGRSRRRTGPATDRGLDFHAGNPLSSLFAHGQEQDLPGSLAIHPVTLRRSTTPDDPLRLAISGASGAAPTRLTMKASSFTDFEAARRFVTCRLRFTTGVTARHARLASGWRAAPLPGGSQTRWIATRGFSSCHPPLQGFPWRNNRSVMG